MSQQHAIRFGAFYPGTDPIPTWAYRDDGQLRAQTFEDGIVRAILIEAGRFHFEDNIGKVSMRLEQIKPRCWYWYAYRRRNGRLQKRYVADASTGNLTAENIHAAIRRMDAATS